MEDVIKKANVLIEAIPYIHEFRRKLFVIKFGGSILDNDAIRKNVLEDIVFLSYVGIKTILVHGGGPHITARMKDAGLKSEFHEGIRVTDKKAINIVKEELTNLNDKLVEEIKSLKGDVTGLRGNENIIHVIKKQASKDLGFVGTIKKIEHDVLNSHLKKGRITVLSPMGICGDKQPHNINGDEVASAIAHSMEAEKLVLLTDVQGVMQNAQDPDSLISTLTVAEVKNLIERKVIVGGMIPKVNSCIEALNGNIKKTHIIDARIAHALLLEFFTTKGIGTQILKG
jgi:acetylglutamate kinase